MPEFKVRGGVTIRSSVGSSDDNHTTLQSTRVRGGIDVRLSPRSAVPASQLLGPVTVLKYAVHDLAQWIDELSGLGIGPWWVSENQAPETFVFRGKQSNARFTWGLTWSGDVMHEIIQPLDDEPSPYREFLASGREGLHHGAFYPRDYDRAVEYLRGSGKKLILHGHSGGARFVYFEGIGSPPQPIELQYLPADLVAQHRILKRVSQEWDGTDPFRGPPRQWW